LREVLREVFVISYQKHEPLMLIFLQRLTPLDRGNISLKLGLNVSSVPTLAIFSKGEIKWRQPGVQQANSLVQLLNKYIVS
jgi:hypothetical protein